MKNTEKAKAQLQAILAVRDFIKEVRTIPSGHLYARLMEHGWSLEFYQSVIVTLERAGVIKLHPTHLIEWVGSSADRSN
jgi:hypothetical protein